MAETKSKGRGHQHVPRPTCVAATYKPNLVVTCDDAGGVYRWNLDDGSKVALSKPRESKASYVTVSKKAVDGVFYVLSAGVDGLVAVSNLETRQRMALFAEHLEEGGPKTEVWSVAVSPGGAMALSGTNGGEIRYWDIKSVTTRHKWPPDLLPDP